MKGEELLALLKQDGWYLARQKGSHRQFKHPVKPGVCTVAFHRASDEIPVGTLNSVLKQAGLK